MRGEEGNTATLGCWGRLGPSDVKYRVTPPVVMAHAMAMGEGEADVTRPLHATLACTVTALLAMSVEALAMLVVSMLTVSGAAEDDAEGEEGTERLRVTLRVVEGTRTGEDEERPLCKGDAVTVTVTVSVAVAVTEAAAVAVPVILSVVEALAVREDDVDIGAETLAVSV